MYIRGYTEKPLSISHDGSECFSVSIYLKIFLLHGNIKFSCFSFLFSEGERPPFSFQKLPYNHSAIKHQFFCS